MSTRFEEVSEVAMKLPPRDRARLAQRLMYSLDDEGQIEEDEDIAASWQKVAERRLEELQSGKVKGVDATKAFERARRALRR